MMHKTTNMPTQHTHILALKIVLTGCIALTAAHVGGQTNQPPATQPQTTQPQATQPSRTQLPAARDMLNDMLRPGDTPAARPLQPINTDPVVDISTGRAAVAPAAPQLMVLREGSYVVDRMGRLKKNDAQMWELTFESDGKLLQDPPVIVLPNLKLQIMEDQLRQTRRDLKFRVTGMVTEYRGRNYLLLDKVIIVSE
jgi:hypothetical protein